jgi:hypothetical protein
MKPDSTVWNDCPLFETSFARKFPSMCPAFFPGRSTSSDHEPAFVDIMVSPSLRSIFSATAEIMISPFLSGAPS